MRNIRVFSILGLILFSCITSETELVEENILINYSEVLRKEYSYIIEDSITSNMDTKLQLDSNKLIIYNEKKNSLDFYKIDESIVLTKTISLENLIIEDFHVESFTFINWDSIFLLDDFGNRLIHIDSSVFLRQSTKLEDFLNEKNKIGFEIFGDYNSPLSFNRDKGVFYIAIRPNYPVSNNSHYKENVLLEYFLEKSEANFSGNYPKKFSGKQSYFMIDDILTYYSKNLGLILTFPINDEISVYKENGMEEISLRSNFKIENTPIGKFGSKISLYDQRKYHIEQGFYWKTLYNKDIDCFVRIFKKPSLYIDGGNIIGTFQYEHSIILFQPSSNKRLEIELPVGVYNFFQIETFSNGILIGKNNPENEAYTEDVLRFDYLDFSKIVF